MAVSISEYIERKLKESESLSLIDSVNEVCESIKDRFYVEATVCVEGDLVILSYVSRTGKIRILTFREVEKGNE